MNQRKLRIRLESIAVESFETAATLAPAALAAVRMTRVNQSYCAAGCDPSDLQPPCTAFTYQV